MGNTSSKNNDYQQYYDSIQKEQQIDLTSLDPYKVLNISKNFEWEELKTAYKNAAILTHPDKVGGNKFAFDFVTTCFKTLANEYKIKKSDKSHIDMKKESNDYFEKIINTNVQHPSMTIDKNETFQKRFNKVFDDNKFQDEEIEYGYGNKMEKSSGIREDISIENVFNKSKVNNASFNELFNKKVPVSKDIIKYKEPEALSISKNLQFTEIGSTRTDDYSSDTTIRTLAYTDYMKAYNGMRLADQDDIKKIKNFKSVVEYETYRDKKIKKVYSDKERNFIEKNKQLEENKEFERLERIKTQNIAIQKAYEKANKLLLI